MSKVAVVSLERRKILATAKILDENKVQNMLRMLEKKPSTAAQIAHKLSWDMSTVNMRLGRLQDAALEKAPLV